MRATPKETSDILLALDAVAATKPVELTSHTLASILGTLNDGEHSVLFKLLCNAIGDGRLIIDGITPTLIKSVTNPERRQELVKAICLRKIRQGDSN